MKLLKALGLAAAFIAGLLLFALFYTYIVIYHPVLTIAVTLLIAVFIVTYLIYEDLR